MTPRRGACSALAGLLLVAVVACGGDPAAAPSPSPTATAAAPSLLVDVERSRAAAGRGVLEVRLRTTDDDAFEVTRLQLLDDRFATVPPARKSTPVRRGAVGIITPIPEGEVRCDAERGAGPRVAVTVATAGGVHDLVVPVSPAGDDVLTRLHADECRRRALLTSVDLAFGDDWTTVSPATARGTIRLARRSVPEQVVLEAVQGTVIFSLRVLAEAAPGAVLRLPAGADVTEVPVEVSAARCDPHALIESKKTYLFPMWVRRGAEPAVFVTVQPAGPARSAFEALLAEGCHLEE